ncbi:MAG: hypothetical protein JWO03_1106 [Bacteroidetes bacterium]|nr:hypothetical protein [Bacteroidota bacterium]
MKNGLLFLFISLAFTTFGQKHKSKISTSDFDIQAFNSKVEVAEWLEKYDYVAWHTSDSVSASTEEEKARLGREWFCYQDDQNTWHAVYGKFDGTDFDLVFHYHLDDKYHIHRVYDKVDTSLLNGYSRALNTANNILKPLRDTVKVHMNQFIRKNSDNTFAVWIFPSFQPNSTAVYGGEFIYTIDGSGSKLLKDDSYFQGNFRGFKVGEPRDIWLNYRELDKPSLGGIFFVIYYQKYFTKIYLDNKDFATTLIKDDNGKFSWMHAQKDIKKK